MLDELLRALSARLDRITHTRDLSLALEPGALETTERLTEALLAIADDIGDPGADDSGLSEGWRMIGELHMYRFVELPQDEREEDFEAGISAFTRYFLVGHDVPGYLRVSVADQAAGQVNELYQQATQAGDWELLTTAINLWRRVLTLTPDDDPDRSGRLHLLGAALHSRFTMAGEFTDLEEAVIFSRQAVDTALPDDRFRAIYSAQLSEALRTRFTQFGDDPDLAQAITYARQAIPVIPDGDPLRPDYLLVLGLALRERAEHTGSIADIDEAVDVCREALATTLGDDAGRPRILSNLGVTLQTRFELTGDPASLRLEIDVLRSAVATTVPGDPGAGMYLSNLSNALRTSFGQAADPADLEDAISAARRAVTVIDPANPDRAMYLSNLSLALQARYVLTRQQADLQESVAVLQLALDGLPASHPHQALVQTNLSNALRARYEESGAEEDVTGAIAAARHAAGLVPAGDPRRVRSLVNLGVALAARFSGGGDPADLDEAITVTREAVAAIAADAPDLAVGVASLSRALRARLDRLGDRPDADEAVLFARQAVSVTGAGHPDRPEYLHVLGEALRARYERFGAAGDIDEAVTAARQATETALNDPNRGAYLAGLSAALERQSAAAAPLRGTGPPAAPASATAAAATSPAGRADLEARLSTLFDRVAEARDFSLALDPWVPEAADRIAGLLRADGHETSPADPARAGQADPGDIDTWFLLGTIYWCRFLALPDDHEDEDATFTAAVEAFVPALLAGRAAIPASMIPFVAAAGGDQLADFLQYATRSGDPGLVSASIEMCRRVLAALAPDDPSHALALSNLGSALQSEFELAGDTATLDEAIAVARQAVGEGTDDPDLPMYLSNLGVILLTLFRQAGEPAVAREASTVARRAVELALPDDPNRVLFQTNLSNALWMNSLHLRDRTSLDEAIEVGRRAAETSAGGGLSLVNLGVSLQARYTLTGELADLEECIRICRAGIEALEPGHVVRTTYLASLGSALQLRFARLGQPADLEQAMAVLREAVAASVPGQPDRGICLSNLSGALQTRYLRSGSLADLDEAVAIARQTVLETAADHINMGRYLNVLANGLRLQFESNGDLGALDEAAAVLGPPGAQSAVERLVNLSAIAQARFAANGDRAVIDEAIAAAQEAVAITRDGHLMRAAALTNLSNAHRARFDLSCDLTDLDEAISAGRQAVGLASAGDPVRGLYLSNLANALQRKFDRAGQPEDGEEAISCARAAAASPAGDPNRAMFLSNLGLALLGRFERTGVAADLDEAVGTGRQAVDAAQAGHPRLGVFLSNLAGSLNRHAAFTGDLSGLDEAIGLSRQAVRESPAGQPDRPQCLATLASSLEERFDLAGDMADLAEAEQAAREAVAAAPVGHYDRPRYLTSLAGVLESRFDRTRALADLDEAVSTMREAVATTPPDYPDTGMNLSNLGNALGFRFEHSEDPADLDEAIAANRKAVQSAPGTTLFRAGYQANLGSWLVSRFVRDGTASDLREAVALLGQAVDATTEERPEIAVRLRRLGDALHHQFTLSGAAADEAAAIAAYVRAAGVEVAPAQVRIRAARDAADLLADEDPQQAADVLEAAVHLFPQLAARQLGRHDQQLMLGNFRFLAGNAAALALRAGGQGAPERALGLLELGRAVLHSQALDTRGDLSELRTRAPRLAARFSQLRGLLDPPDADRPVAIAAGAPSATLRQASTDRHRVAAEFSALLAEIRKLHGFETFLLPASAAQLRQQTTAGAIAVINVSHFRCDAILVTDAGFGHVPLPDVTIRLVAEKFIDFDHALMIATHPDATAKQWAGAQDTMSEILEWLWDTTAEPVLRALGHDQPIGPAAAGPRVWWVPGGLMGRLPLHAAGYHREAPAGGESGRRTVMDRVISSYTPTIRALAHSRQQASSTPPKRSLIVAMPTTPGDVGPLPGARREAMLLQSRLPDPTVLIEPSDEGRLAPTRANVLAHLVGSGIAHFACHAGSDPDDPSSSLLVLRDHERQPLTVTSLAQVRLGQAQLAYLSACQTSRNASVDLPDEIIHLTSGFQLAGYPHVIGTLWEINDRIAADIADDFYRRLETRPGQLDPTASARALHAISRGLRDQLPGRPSIWAAYVHAGA
jgi:tetratricopeptide (TPR) repeat protein